MNEYEQKANKFLKNTDTKFKAEFLKNDFHFSDDKNKRDIYLITLKRGEREFKFNFGNSLNNSLKFEIIKGYLSEAIIEKLNKKGLSLNGCNTIEDKKKYFIYFIGYGEFWKENKNFKIPSAYDVLAGLTSYNPATFKEFCLTFDYDEDSKKAEKIYIAVLEEWKNIQILYSDEEILKLHEIQ